MVWLGSPQAYFAMQAPNHALPADGDGFGPQALSLTLQMGNVLLLLALLAGVCCWTPHGATVSRRYLAAVAIADYGHIYAAYRGVGPDHFWHVAGWNDMLWGNVGVSAALNVARLATLLGAFGPLVEAGAVSSGAHQKGPGAASKKRR